MSNTYDNNSISQLKGADRVRKRPEALLGSRGIDGAIHTIQEIIGNSTDEKLSGYGDKLDICYYEDGSISVRDYGRGVPLGWNEKEKNWNYLLIYSELYAGGKYGDNQKLLKGIEESNAWSTFKIMDHPYLISIGLNGLGGACTQYTSEFFDVTSYRDGKASTMRFKKGVAVMSELEVIDTDEPNGTYIHWKPDNEVFTDTDIPVKWFESTCKALSFVAGFTVTLTIGDKVKVYESSDIEKEMEARLGNCVYTNAFKHIVDNTDDVCICDLKVSVGPTGLSQDYYHNMISVRGGAHSQGVYSAYSMFFREVGNMRGIRLSERDYAGKFSIIVSTLANKASLRNQTKDSIDDSWIANFIAETTYQMLYREYKKGTAWIMDIVEEVVQNAENRIALAEMAKSYKEVQKATTKHRASNKFVTCRSYEDGKNASATEFLIVEGDSAGGKVVQARDSNYQCLLKLKGKSLNVFKASIQKLIANKEILDIISVLGCGVDLGINEFETFDINKLKVGKVIFCTDGDLDGYHIRFLLFNIFYKLFPQLLQNGNVYVAETPLYVINTKSDEAIYCMDNAELEEKRKEIGEYNIRSIDRFKGLGECDKSVLWETTLNPETRKLRQIKIDSNDTDIFETLDVLFGKSTESRKRAILGSMLGTDFDETVENIGDLIEYIDGLELNGGLEVEEVEY